MVKDPKSSDLLCLQAEQELARRSLSGSLGQILLVLIFWVGTDAQSRLGNRMSILGSLILLMNFLRLHLSTMRKRYYPTHRKRWNRLFTLCIVGSGLAWGLLYAIILGTLSLTEHATVIALLIGSGICAAITHSVGLHQNLARSFLIMILGIPLAVMLRHMDPQHLPVSLIFVTYFGFLWYQLKIQHDTYWKGLQAKKQLNEQYNRLQAVLDAIPGLVSWIGKDHSYRGVNRNFVENYGGNRADYIKQPLGSRNEDQEYLQTIREFLNSTSDRSIKELQLSGRHGLRWHLLAMEKTYQIEADPDGMEAYFICIDIDELKRTQQTLSDERIKMELASKLATLGEFTANLMHELKNPLTAMATSLELIGRQFETPNPDLRVIRTLVDMSSTACTRMDKITLGMRRFARKGADEPYSITPLNSIIKDSLELTSLQFKSKRIPFHLESLPPDDVPVMCNPVELSQVLINLLQNALDAASEQSEKWVRVSLKSTEETIEITVSDSGTISTDVVERIFEPFFTTKPAGTGTGLGLSISKRIVERHGGQLLLDRLAHNTTFRILLPRARSSRQLQRISA